MAEYNWSEMTPRERDALVAEKVMGWTPDNHQRSLNGDGTVSHYYRTDDCNDCEWFSPSTDISAAWEVVEKMRELDEAQQELFHDHTNYTLFNITPELICLAALRAVGVDV